MQLINAHAVVESDVNESVAKQTSLSLRAALAAATAALLAPSMALAQVTPPPATAPSSAARSSTGAATNSKSVEWKVDSAVLLYAEGGGRVRALEPVVSARRTDGNEVTYGVKLTLDSLTGASPNGAAPQPAPQTFTSPSGESDYAVAAGNTPLDPSFKDTRVALALSMERPLTAAQRLSLGVNFSKEYDFTSFGANAGWARDFNDKNTTLSLGLALEGNRVEPVGGTPVGLRPAFGSLRQRQGDDSRTVVDLLAGVTQVMNRQWLMQLNLGMGRASGYHTDPYKILSVVDGSTGLVTGDGYVSEQRPDSRARMSLFWQNKVHLSRDVLDIGYRYYRDDWGVRAHTLDTRYRFELPGGMHVEPRWRHHRQSAADFWRGWLVEGAQWNSTTHQASLGAASADPRLAAFTGNTLGVKIGAPVGRDSEWSLRLETYRQTQKRPDGAPGALQSLDLAPGLKATAVMFGFNTRF